MRRTLSRIASAVSVAAICLPVALAQTEKETPVANNPVVSIETSMGTIKVELWPDKAPETVKNFLKYAEDGHYDGTIFHRVIPNFMIQGGGLTPDMKPKETRAPIKNEARADARNRRGTIAMARTNEVNSATSQFFINVKDNDFLNHADETPKGFGYCVFGKVTEGMDVVDKIVKTPTASKGAFQDVPKVPVVIASVKKEAKEQ